MGNGKRGSYRRNLTRRQFLRVGALGGAGAFALSSWACGPTESKQESRSEPQPAQTPQPTKPPQPKRGGVLTAAVTFNPQGMDPHTSTAASLRTMGDFFYSTALRFVSDPNSYELEPDVVEKWEQADDLTYVLHVRKGVKWHNLPPVNGRELTAEDIKYNIERIATPKAAFQRRWMFAEVERLEVADKYTIRMITKKPFAPVMNYLAERYNRIVAPEVAEKEDALETTFIGTGPFMVESYTPNVAMRLVRNPDYYVKGTPYLDAVNVPIVTDASAIIAAFRSREIDHCKTTFGDMETLKRNPGDLQFGSILSDRGTALRLRLNRSPFNDVRVRKALQLGVDRKKLIEAVADGRGVPSGPIAPLVKDWALPEAEFNKYLRYDPQEAKKLLVEAGYANGLSFVCDVTSRTGQNWSDSAVILKDQFRAIGVEMEIQVMEHSAYVANQVGREFASMTGSTQMLGPDPDFLYNLLHSKGPRNFSSYNSPKMDEMLDKQRGIFNKTERKKIIQDIQRLALEDLPEVYLFAYDTFMAWQPHLREFKPAIGATSEGLFRPHEYWFDK